MQKDIDTLFGHLWDNYIQVTPSALKVHTLLGGGEPIVNDHVAFRTYNLPKLGLEKLAAMLIEKEVIMSDDIEAIFGPKAGKHGEERLKGDE